MRRQDFLLVVNAGETAPTPLVDRALKAHPHALGVGYIEEDDLVLEADKSVPSLEDFEAHEMDFKSSTRIYSLSSVKGTVVDAELQPLVILKEADINVVVAFFAGEFDVVNDGQLPSAVVLADKVLKPRFEDYWTLSQQSVEKLSKRMEGDVFHQEISMLCSPFKSTLVFMLSNGDIHTFSASETKIDTTWGFASADLGLKEGTFPAEEVAPAAEPVKKRLGGIKPSGDAKPAEVAKPAPAPAPVPTGKVTTNGATTVIHKGPVASDLVAAAAAQNVVELVWVAPKDHMKERKLHDWYYKNNGGVVPTNLNARPPIQMAKEKAIRLGSVQIVPAPGDTNKSYRAFNEIKKEDVKTVPAASPAAPDIEKAAPAKPTSVPLTPIEIGKRVEAVVQNMKVTQDPTDWAKLENASPTFWKRYNITQEATFQWPYTKRLAIAQISPNDAALAWSNCEYKIYIMLQEIARLNSDLEKLTAPPVTEPVPAEQTRKKIGGIRR